MCYWLGVVDLLWVCCLFPERPIGERDPWALLLVYGACEEPTPEIDGLVSVLWLLMKLWDWFYSSIYFLRSFKFKLKCAPVVYLAGAPIFVGVNAPSLPGINLVLLEFIFFDRCAFVIWFFIEEELLNYEKNPFCSLFTFARELVEA